VVSPLIEKVRSRGHWSISIRPSSFDPMRVDYSALEDIVESLAVRFRGWPVPVVDRREQPLRGEDWVGQDIDASMVSHYEAWRFFTSGQFNHLRAVSADWREGRERTYVPSGYDAVIEVWEILFYLTEVFEFAARLALSDAGDDPMVIGIGVEALGNRALVVGQHNRAEFIEPYRTPTTYAVELSVGRDDLVARPRELAAEAARTFFLRCGWKPPIEQLLEHQRELTERR
jgi:hypothetical protein